LDILEHGFAEIAKRVVCVLIPALLPGASVQLRQQVCVVFVFSTVVTSDVNQLARIHCSVQAVLFESACTRGIRVRRLR
jgi:hypothetical protein